MYFVVVVYFFKLVFVYSTTKLMVLTSKAQLLAVRLGLHCKDRRSTAQFKHRQGWHLGAYLSDSSRKLRSSRLNALFSATSPAAEVTRTSASLSRSTTSAILSLRTFSCSLQYLYKRGDV